ncbi:Slc47a2, partial [Symbiodinium microadriaticum]
MDPPACGHSTKDLLRRLAVVSLPSYPIFVATRSVGLVSTAMVGRHVQDPAALAAVGLSNVITNITGYSALWGLSSAVSTFSSQDWGAGNFRALGVTLQRAYLILVLFVCLPLLVLWLNSERLLVACGQHPDVAHYVGIYTSVRCWSLVCMPMNCVLSRTLGAMSNVQINLIMSLTASVLNVVLSSTLVPRLGFVGAPLTACICDIYESIGIFILATRNADFRKCWGGFSRAAWHEWLPYCKVALPALVLMCIEWWTWDLQSFIAGFISEDAQAVQSVAPAVGDLQYALGQAFGNGAATVVGNMLGEGDLKAAKRAASLTVGCNALVMMLQLLVFIIFRSDVASLFTQNSDILAGIISLLPFSLSFSFIDGNQSAICGVLTGAGKQDLGAGIVFVCYWVVGVPLGILLAFGTLGTVFGLEGLWIGMLVAVSGHLSLFLLVL